MAGIQTLHYNCDELESLNSGQSKHLLYKATS